MTLLYPHVLWLIVPLALLLYKGPRLFISRVHLVVLILIILALSRPVYESVLQETKIQAKDVIIALDVSYSMQATDIKPTRYTFAKETINALLASNPTDNVMLMAFTTNPLLLSPPTTDHRLISIALESLNPEFILTKGTSLETLFKKLASMHLGQKHLLLITDGGEEDNLASLTNTLQDTDLSLTLLALGTTTGTTVTQKDGNLLKDNEGNLVISRINPLLESLVDTVNGTYLQASHSAQKTAQEISDILQNAHTTRQEVEKQKRDYFELYQIPLALAALLFLMLHTRAVKYLVLLFSLLGLQAQASMLDVYHLHKAYTSYESQDFNRTLGALKKIESPSLQSQITLANTYYKQNAFKRAIRIYKSIRTTSPKIKQQLYYNIANAYSLQKVYSKAKIYYTKALQLGLDKDAKHNLEIVTLLKDQKDARLGIAHPKSQDASSSKSESQGDKDKSRSEDAPSSGSGSGGESHTKSDNKEQKLVADQNEEKHPLSSKVYELINKGYIRETQPW